MAAVKIRRTPEDFRVDELAAPLSSSGPFALYRLTKTSIGTPEAVQAIVQRWGVHRKRISYGGLKDRHAVTSQHLTIHNGPRKSLQQKSLHVEYLGQTAAAFTSVEILANRFQLTLRDLTATAAADILRHYSTAAQTGIPNYFDDQRFGSLGQSGEWIARAWCRGDWERALWLAMADPHPNDPADERRQKQILRDNWGKWPECQALLERSHRRSIVTYLSDKVKVGKPADFRGALARIQVDLRGLYLSAWQSALWNRLLSRYLENASPNHVLPRIELTCGPVTLPIPQDPAATAAWLDQQLPLPSARIDRPEGLVGELLDQVLAEEGVELREVRVKYPRDSFFSKGSRRAWIIPASATSAEAADELYPGRRKIQLSFELPRGSYATMLVKRITECPQTQQQ
jgi:tRNA pseudouridine13 synthase